VNTTTDRHAGLSVGANVYSLDNRLLLRQEEKKDAIANSVTDGFKLDIVPLLAANEVVLVKLELHDSEGKTVSENFYWLGADSAAFRRLNRLPASSLSVTAVSTREGKSIRVRLELRNNGAVASLADKLTLLNALNGSRILPAYYSDNYVSLLPGESRRIEIEYQAKQGNDKAQVAVRGWNLPGQVFPISADSVTK